MLLLLLSRLLHWPLLRSLTPPRLLGCLHTATPPLSFHGLLRRLAGFVSRGLLVLLLLGVGRVW